MLGEGVFGPRKENNGLKGPCWIIWLQREKKKTKWTISPALMLWACCIYLGLITPWREDLSPPAQNLPPPAQLQMLSQLKITQNILPDYCFLYRFHKPPFKYEASLIPLVLSLVIRPTVASPCLCMGNLPRLRSSLLFFLGLNYILHWERLKAGGEGDNRGWNWWMASLTQWTWVWASSESWWRTGKPGML